MHVCPQGGQETINSLEGALAEQLERARAVQAAIEMAEATAIRERTDKDRSFLCGGCGG